MPPWPASCSPTRCPTDWGLGFAGVLALLGLALALVADRAHGARRRWSPAPPRWRRSRCRSSSTSSSPSPRRWPPARCSTRGRRGAPAGPADDGRRGEPDAMSDALAAVRHRRARRSSPCVTRALFLFSRARAERCPAGLQRGLRYAPLAALAAVVGARGAGDAGPAVAGTWQDARLVRRAGRRAATTSGAAACSAPSSSAWRCCSRCASDWAGSVRVARPHRVQWRRRPRPLPALLPLTPPRP